MVFGRLIRVILPVAISVVVGLVVGLVIGYRRIDADWFFNPEIFLFFLGGRPLGAIFANFFVKQRLVRIVGFLWDGNQIIKSYLKMKISRF